MPRGRKTTDSNSTTPNKRRRTKPKIFHFKKHQPGGSVPYPEEAAPAFDLESVSKALSQGWDPNTSWTEDELVFAPPGGGCVMPTTTDPWSHFNTPLHRALFQKQFDVAQLLLDRGADINLLNASGRTVLHEAIDQGINTHNRGWTETSKWIVEHGANLDKKTEDRTVVVTKESHTGESRDYHRSGGISPLRMAVTLRDLTKVQHLAEAGANVGLPLDGEGCWSPLDVAFLRRQMDMVEILENAGASFPTEIENSGDNDDDDDDLQEYRSLLSFCMSGEGFIFHSAEKNNSIPPSSCQAVFRSIVNTDEFRSAWGQQGPSRYQASVSTFFRILSKKAQMRNPLEIPKSYCGLCKDVIKRLNSSKSHDLQHAPNLQELERTARDGCPLCGLLLDAVDKSTVPQSLGNQTIGSSEDDKGHNPEGTDPGDKPITLRVFDTFRGGRLQVRHGDKMSSLQISLLEEEFLDYSPDGREEQAEGTGSSRALSLSKIWLRRCREEHPDCRRLHDSTDPILPTRVMDVTGGTLHDPKIKLIETSRVKRGTYCALSYCWGKSRCVITTKANLADHKQDIPLSTLPRTIRDAVLATRGLGIDYVWVDSLCIVQDDTDDWAAEAARMGDVYANAMLTISTLSGTDCNDGLFTPHYLRQQYVLPFPIPPTSRPTRDAQWLLPAVQPPVKENQYGVLQLPLRGPVHSRGWTFQEQMLSTRILWFGDGHVQWECLSKFAADSSPESMGHYQNPGNNSDEPYRSRRMKEHLQRPFKVKTSLSHSEQQDHETGRGNEDPVDAYTEWETLVAEYTTRNLTKESDRIPAILGLANVMGPMFECKFFMGIWKGKHFLRSLLWQVNRGTSTCANSYPTWTWASKSGCAIDYSMANLDGGRAGSWPTSLVAIDETQGSITLKGPVGKLTPEQMEKLAGHLGFNFTTKLSMDDDPKQSPDKPLSTYLDFLQGNGRMPTWNDPRKSLLQRRSIWYVDIVKYEHGAGHQGYGLPMWPTGQPASVVRLLLEAADREELPSSFKRVGIAHVQLEELEGMMREVVIV
ncbi:heterokaryon incompatibility protein-domain-containing protein [Fusarium flagelliforme]|uniref:heterokaryon incompatibility protein-domain-containing protein n=1 Tax=Fusarium flagelliforme TaxID=2675880 RepID=UPI001E8D26D7|nr:heterokaryon incompatibility protein-domain-containing protein [Fusarium flagelliforme]KAH7186058.1 heterokaryon incompatibility protein-domain-containing protein [Fusarium flagelliforme]